MRVRMSVVVPDSAGGASLHDVDVRGLAGSTVADLRQQLPWLPASLMVESARLREAVAVNDASAVGLPPLIDGCTIAPSQLVQMATARALLRVDVISGPQSGTCIPMHQGMQLLGRGSACSVRLDDPEISRVHVSLMVRDGVVTACDLSSTGTAVIDERPIGRGGRHWPLGACLRVGATSMRLSLPRSDVVPTEPDALGGLLVNRPPQSLRATQPAVIELPAPPTRRERPRLAWAGIIVPLIAGAGFLVLSPGQSTFLLFLLLSPVMALTGYLGERTRRRRADNLAQSDYDRRLSSAEAELVAALDDEKRRRVQAQPDAVQLLDMATLPTGDLWHRRPGDATFLSSRVGLGTLAAESSAFQMTPDGARTPVRQTVGDVPVIVHLGRGAIGITEAAAISHRLPEWIVAQVLGLHSPLHLRVVALVSDRSTEWSWLQWAPHRTLVARTPEQIAAAADDLLALLQFRIQQRPPVCEPAVVVVLQGARRLRRSPAVARLLAEGMSVGIHCMCIDDNEACLPVECAVVVATDAESSVVVTTDSAPVRGLSDRISDGWLQTFVRALAPLRDATPDADANLPDSTRLLQLVDIDALDPGALARHWRESTSNTRAVLGLGSAGTLAIDLRTDGPHFLVAGTTGAGKSELLQTLVASLAIGSRPDELTFVLVDYKGGAAFAECAGLPHVVGMVTDLDSALTSRALASLTAELKRREHLLAAMRVTDLDAYRTAVQATGGPAIARLVLVVDEFATLKEELPDFVDGLVGIAQRGRSLGVHLVLATQRPSGVISPNIRANTNARIALRMTDAAESSDVIDRPDAATLSAATPGRALLRVGGGALTLFQTARISGRTPDVDAISVRPLGVEAAFVQNDAEPSGVSDLAKLVASAQAAARELGTGLARAPWLAPLPDTIAAADLVASPRALAYGMSDRPAEQAQPVAELDLDAGAHLLIVGAGRSGRSTVLATLAAEAAVRGDVHIYAYDFDGALASLRAVPACGAVIDRDEPARGGRLLTRLLALIRERRSRPPSLTPAPVVLLLVDGWDGFVSTYETYDNGAATALLLQVLREGPAVGLLACITGDRSTLTGRLGPLMTQRLVLRMADPADVSLAGISPKAVPSRQPPGRGIMATTGDAVQVATPRVLPHPPVPREPPLACAALPDHLPASDLPAIDHSPLMLSLGVGGDDAGVLTLDLALDGPALLVCGPPRSGKSSTAVTLLHQLTARGTRTAVLAGRRSPLTAAATRLGSTRLDAAHAAGLSGLLDGEPLALLVDDCDDFTDTAVEGQLAELLRPDSPHAGTVGVVLTAETSVAATSFRGLSAAARRGRTGVVLMATGAPDEALLGRRIGACDNPRPGRGVLVVGSDVTPLQLALAQPTGRCAPSP